MKRLSLAAAFLLYGILAHAPALAQSLEDVVYFKNGAVLHGLIMEEDPALWLKIKTADGAVHTYSMADVEKVLKTEPPPSASDADSGAAASYPSTSNSDGNVSSITPGTAFLLSFLLPGLGCYVNGGNDTAVGLICDGLYVGGITLALTAGISTTQVDLGYGESISTVTISPFFWAGFGVAAGGWILGMIDAPSYAATHQPRRNSYGDLWQFHGPGYDLGLNLASGAGPNPSALPLPALAFRF